MLRRKEEKFIKAAVKFKWKLGQNREEQEVLTLLNQIKEKLASEPVEYDAVLGSEVIGKIARAPAHFTPLLSDVLSAVVKPNYFLLPHREYEFNRLNLTYVVMSKRKTHCLGKRRFS